MDEVEVAQVEMADVPTTFDESVVLLDVREDDEWQRGHAAGAQHIPMGEVPAADRRDRSRREAVRGLPSRWPLPAGGAVSRAATATRRSTSAAACRPGLMRVGPSSPTAAASAPSEQPSLGWSDDPGVFPVRDAVERARPAARLVPAVQRRPAGAVGPGAPAAASGAPVRRAPPRHPRCARRPGGQNGTPRLPPGYRWIAVRPGAAPPPRRRRRPISAPPRATRSFRAGVSSTFRAPELQQQAEPRRGPSLAALRATLVATIAVLGVAALVHVVRYALLIINRIVLLNPVVAWLATWLGVLVSVVALFMSFASVVVLTNWLIARRAAAFEHTGREDPRPVWALRAGCLVPLVNLAWAPVFVLELAGVEERLNWLRRPIVVWWSVWVLQHRGVGVLDRDELHPDAAGHRGQHRDHDRRLSAGAGGDAAGR